MAFAATVIRGGCAAEAGQRSERLRPAAGGRYTCRIRRPLLFLILFLLIAASIAAVAVLPLPIVAGVPVLLAVSAFLLGREPVRKRAKGGSTNSATAVAGGESVCQALDNVPAGVILHRDGRVLFANRRMRLLLGRESDFMDGTALNRLVPPEELAALGGLGADSELPRELTLLKADGSTVSVEASGGQVRLSDGSAAMICVVDVSGRREESARRGELAAHTRKLEEQLEHSARLAELGEMAASISHELNQPLTGIRNYARNAYYMLDQKAGAEADVKNNLRLISEQVDRAAKIINQMRELSRRATASSCSWTPTASSGRPWSSSCRR